jgi:hypothetical protein
MLNKVASIVIAAALVCTLAGTPAFANTLSKSDPKIRESADRLDSGDEANTAAHEKLRAEIFKLITDANAGGKGVNIPRPQIQSPQQNNLTKGAKIAIGVGIAVAVVAVILISTRCSNEPGAC